MKITWLLAFLNGLYFLLLGLWIGSLVLSAASAAVVFPLMRALGPSLPKFAPLPDGHATLLAGRLMATVFFMQDLIELLACAGVVAILFMHLAVFRMPARSPSNVVRLLAAAVLLASVSYEVFVLAPRMNDHLRHYWSAAETGETDRAQVERTAFLADHPQATRMMLITLGALVVMIFASAAALSAPAPEVQQQPKHGVELEEPELLRRMGR